MREMFLHKGASPYKVNIPNSQSSIKQVASVNYACDSNMAYLLYSKL